MSPAAAITRRDTSGTWSAGIEELEEETEPEVEQLLEAMTEVVSTQAASLDTMKTNVFSSNAGSGAATAVRRVRWARAIRFREASGGKSATTPTAIRRTHSNWISSRSNSAPSAAAKSWWTTRCACRKGARQPAAGRATRRNACTCSGRAAPSSLIRRCCARRALRLPAGSLCNSYPPDVENQLCDRESVVRRGQEDGPRGAEDGFRSAAEGEWFRVLCHQSTLSGGPQLIGDGADVADPNS